MRTHLLSSLFAALLFGAFGVSHAAPIMVRDWTIDTPVGRFGYAEVDYTMRFHIGPGPRIPDRYIYLGPLGRVELPVFVLASVILGGGALVWIVSRFRRRAHAHTTA